MKSPMKLAMAMKMAGRGAGRVDTNKKLPGILNIAQQAHTPKAP